MSLVVKNLTARSGGKKYLDGVSLEVGTGEACALAGRGKEKLLFLRLIRECLKKGCLVESGEVLARADTQHGVMIFEGDNLFDFMSVRQYVLYATGAIRLARRQRLVRALECFALVGLSGDILEKGVGELSRLQRCLLSIALGMFESPKVLLLCLDTISGKEAVRAIGCAVEKIKAQGVTVVAAIGDMSLAVGFDKLAVMEKGRITDFGAPSDILPRYNCSVFTIKTTKSHIKQLKEQMHKLSSVVKVTPRGDKLYLYSIDKRDTGKAVLKAMDGGAIEEVSFCKRKL